MDLSERPTQAFQRHPWEVSRFRFFRRVLGVAAQRPARVLDVGAGDAWFSRELLATLPADVRVTCWDVGYTPDALRELAREGDPRIAFAAERVTGTFDLVLLLDVLEHVEHDAAFLGTLVRDNLADGAVALVSVPAWQRLYTSHDTHLRHYRRYTPAQGRALVEGAGLSVVRSGGLFHSLLLPRALAKVRETLRAPAADAAPATLEWHAGALVTRAVDLALAADNALSFHAARYAADVPGLSWWALCKKS